MSPRKKRLNKIRKLITKAKRLRIYAMDGNQCVYCGATDKRLTLDHLRPVRVMVGLPPCVINSDENLMTACDECNTRLGQIVSVFKFPLFGRFQQKEVAL